MSSCISSSKKKRYELLNDLLEYFGNFKSILLFFFVSSQKDLKKIICSFFFKVFEILHSL